MSGSGVDSWASVVEEATYGTSPGAGESYFELVSEDLGMEIPLKYRKSLRGVSHQTTFQGNKVVGGSLTVEALYEGFLLFLKHAMGDYAFTIDTPVAGANQHVFTLADALPIGLSVEASKGDIPTGKVFLYQGGKVDELSFALTEEELLALTIGMIFQTETGNTTASGTPSYPGDHPVLWHHSGTITLAGTAAIDFKAANVKLQNMLSRDRFLMNQTIRSPKRTGRRPVTGDVTIEFDDLTLYDKFVAGTKGAFELMFTSEEFITGTTPYSLKIECPNVQLESVSPAVGGEGVIEVTIPFVGLHSTGADDAMTITVINGEATL